MSADPDESAGEESFQTAGGKASYVDESDGSPPLRPVKGWVCPRMFYGLTSVFFSDNLCLFSMFKLFVTHEIMSQYPLYNCCRLTEKRPT